MDSSIGAAARALCAGDPLGALDRIALREDAPALALRGIAMAQLGELGRARDLLHRAVRRFGSHETVARARCTVADAEIALAMRDITWSKNAVELAIHTLEARGDRLNALHGRLVAIRRLVLLGRIEEARRAIASLDASRLPPSLGAVLALTAGELAIRACSAREAREALERAADSARRAEVPALEAEIDRTRAMLARPVARLCRQDREELVALDALEAVFASDALVVDACRRTVRAGAVVVRLHRRPVLFALVRCLAENAPSDASRGVLLERAFSVKRPSDSHRARLRVEMGRLRRAIAPIADVRATRDGFALEPRGSGVSVLLPPIDGEHASLLALLADGEAWSSASLALALGQSQRNVQRALAELEHAGVARAAGKTRARRFLAPPVAGFATTLLLPATIPFA